MTVSEKVSKNKFFYCVLCAASKYKTTVWNPLKPDKD
jgi:hypothetical protein